MTPGDAQPEPLYLDHNATTPVRPEVVEAMLPYLTQHFGNPSSAHVFGARAKVAVECAREQVAELLGCQAEELVFTSGGTEANNLALFGATAASPRRHLVTTVIEHPATSRPCERLERQGWAVTRLGVDGEGQLLPPARWPSELALVSVMHANNETGVLQPVEALAAAARGVGALVHVDAAQSVGKVPVRVDVLGVDLLSVAGHKLYAPKGVGALYVRRGTRLEPFALGAGHERGLRPGTENVASVVGLGEACALAARELAQEGARQVALRDALEARLRAAVPGLARHGHATARLPNTLNVRFPGATGSAVLAHAPSVAASTGSACHAGHETPSGVLVAMGLAPREALGAVRLSLGRGTTLEDVEHAAQALAQAWRRAVAGA